MENFRWSEGKSADQLADYMSYALRILKNVDLPCEGITTPGGFAGRVLPELAQATLQACREVFQAEIPHYFRHAFTDSRSVAPRVEYAADIDGPDPRCVVSMIGCTGDWLGGWDGLAQCSLDKIITEDSKGGRLPEVIRRGEPAIMYSHWPGIYWNGKEDGFKAFQQVVQRLEVGFDNLIWMKLSEIARYWAARELTRIEREANIVTFHAPFACPQFTVSVPGVFNDAPRVTVGKQPTPLTQVSRPLDLKSGTWSRQAGGVAVCLDLPKGASTLTL
jgi:hypothetical protein